MKSMVSICGLWAATIGLAAHPAAAQSTVYSFGDSLSDNGNVRAVTFGLEAGDEYFQGRFSNGFVWSDLLSVAINGDLQRTNPGLIGPFAAGRTAGYNFAHGGAVSGNNGLNFNAFFEGRVQGTLLELLPPFVLTEQAEHFRDQRFFFRRTFRASDDDVATISSGGNDYFNGETDVDFVVGSIIEAIDTIEDNRINNFIVLDLPNVGDIPARIGDPNQALLNQLSVEHNAVLRAEANAIEARRNINVVIVPVGDLFDQIVADADLNGGSLFGFTTVRPGEGTTGNCLGDGLVLGACPDSYLFYDGIHPTARAHALISDLALGTVYAESAAAIDSGARLIAVNQISTAQNRLMNARLSAAQAGQHASGFLSDGLNLGGAPAALSAGGLAFREIDASRAGQPTQFYRDVDGAAPEVFAFTPADDLFGAVDATSLRLSAGEYVS
ncbi:MAG: SGNH/GDSL hydrolase family protein, partial [Pseudomonadota bacterium]